MKYAKQVGIILGITMVGEILYQVLPPSVPAGVYELFIMLATLASRAVKLESVEGTGNFLVDIMTMMLVPATAGTVEYIGEIKVVLVPFLLITTMSIVLMMIVIGHMAQWVMQFKEIKEEE